MKQNRISRQLQKWLRRACAWLVVGSSATVMSAQVLPPAPAPNRAQSLSATPQLLVQAFHFEGNHAFSNDELSNITEPFTHRQITNEELEQARRAVTLFYVNHGYINSGAVIPDQDPTNGIVVMHIVEGVLSGIELRGNHWLRDSYITNRVKRWSAAPLNLTRLQGRLQLLRQNPNITQINAELKPGAAPGEGRLELRVEDQQPFRVGLQVDNQRPPSVGAEEVWALLSDVNLTGNSDVLDLRYGIANAGRNGPEFSGADNMEGSYVLPFTRFDTTIALQASRLNSTIVEAPFDLLNIESLTTTYGAVLRQPVYQTANQEAAISIGFDYRENETWLFGVPDDLSPGSVDGKMKVSALRVSQEWIGRGQNHVLALRSTFNFGLDILDATDSPSNGVPNAQFFSWLGQGQYVRRLFGTQNQLVMRLAGQWSAEPLLALDQFSVGGMNTVRGYLENQLVRDRALVASVEFRLPVLYDKAGAGILDVAPFFDFGGGWNADSLPKDSPSYDTIYSVGSGLLYHPNKHVSAELYWGYRIQHIDVPNDAGAQGVGISFRVIVQAF